MSARKAFSVLLKTEENFDIRRFIDSVKIYALEHAGDQYTYKLGNFIREEYYKDIYDQHDSIVSYLSKLEREAELANSIINEWNAKCLKHWCRCVDNSSRLPIVRKSLGNTGFRSNWKQALELASKIFKYERKDGDPLQRVNLSLKWFCCVEPDKHTVMKLIEGEYGKPQSDRDVRYGSKFKPLSDVERETNKHKAAKDFFEVFGRWPANYRPKEEVQEGDGGSGSKPFNPADHL